MKRSTASDNNRQRQPGLRYFIVSNVKIVFFGALIFIILWLTSELLFPRLARGGGAESQTTETISKERPYPFTTTEFTDISDWEKMQWSIRSIFNEGVGDCEIGIEENDDISMQGEKIGFNFMYGTPPVNFYQETVPVKVARILDIIRAPEAAKDQIGMRLYDVDMLSKQKYKELLDEWAKSMLGTIDTNHLGKGLEPAQPPMMAFVTMNTDFQTVIPISNTDSRTTIPIWDVFETIFIWIRDMLKWNIGESEFIGAPVRWNEDLANLLVPEADENKYAECYSPKLIKRAMYDVIASSVEGIRNVGTQDSQRSDEIAKAKVYLAIMSGDSMTLEDVDSIRTVSFRSAWP